MGLNWQHTIINNRDLVNTPRMVMFVLADKCKDSERSLKIGMDKLAWMLNLSVKQTRRVLDWLKSQKFIDFQPGNGRGILTEITFLFAQKKGGHLDSEKVDIGENKGGHLEQNEEIKVDISDQKGGHSPARANKDLFPPFTTEEKEESFLAVEIVESVLQMSIPAHVIDGLTNAGIKHLDKWRELLTERKIGMTEGQFKNTIYKSRAVEFALADYKKWLAARPVTSETKPIPVEQFLGLPEIPFIPYTPKSKEVYS